MDKALRFAGGFILTAVAVTAVARYWWVILAVVVIAIVAFVTWMHLCVSRPTDATDGGRARGTGHEPRNVPARSSTSTGSKRSVIACSGVIGGTTRLGSLLGPRASRYANCSRVITEPSERLAESGGARHYGAGHIEVSKWTLKPAGRTDVVKVEP